MDTGVMDEVYESCGYRVAHMSAYPPLGQVEANGFHRKRMAALPPPTVSGRVDRSPQPKRDKSASISHSKNKLKINSNFFFSPTHWREPADVTDEPVEFEK